MELLETLQKIPVPVLAFVVLVLLVVTIVIGFQYLKMKGLEGIRGDVYQLFLLAERRYTNSSAGKQKMKWVIQQARGLIPGWMQMFITEDMLEKILEKWFRGVKDLLDDGKINNSVNGKTVSG